MLSDRSRAARLPAVTERSVLQTSLTSDPAGLPVTQPVWAHTRLNGKVALSPPQSTSTTHRLRISSKCRTTILLFPALSSLPSTTTVPTATMPTASKRSAHDAELDPSSVDEKRQRLPTLDELIVNHHKLEHDFGDFEKRYNEQKGLPQPQKRSKDNLAGTERKQMPNNNDQTEEVKQLEDKLMSIFAKKEEDAKKAQQKLQDEIKNLRDEQKKLQVEKQEDRDEIKKIRDDIKTTRTDSEKIQAENKQFQDDIQHLKDEKEKIVAKNVKLEADQQNLLAKNVYLDADQKKIIAENVRLDAEQKELKAMNQQLNVELENLRNDCKVELRNLRNDCTGSVAHVMDDILKLQTVVSNLHAQINPADHAATSYPSPGVDTEQQHSFENSTTGLYTNANDAINNTINTNDSMEVFEENHENGNVRPGDATPAPLGQYDNTNINEPMDFEMSNNNNNAGTTGPLAPKLGSFSQPSQPFGVPSSSMVSSNMAPSNMTSSNMASSSMGSFITPSSSMSSSNGPQLPTPKSTGSSIKTNVVTRPASIVMQSPAPAASLTSTSGNSFSTQAPSAQMSSPPGPTQVSSNGAQLPGFVPTTSYVYKPPVNSGPPSSNVFTNAMAALSSSSQPSAHRPASLGNHAVTYGPSSQ